MASKWLELLKGIAPSIEQVAYVFNPDTAPGVYPNSIETAAPLLSLRTVAVAVHDTAEMERLIERIGRQANSGLLVVPDVFTSKNRQAIITLCARHRLPAIYPFRYFAANGGLMSYGIEVLDTYRQAASYVDRILQGEKPSDLPVQRPTKFQFVVNLVTAKALGLAVAPEFLVRADEVME